MYIKKENKKCIYIYKKNPKVNKVYKKTKNKVKKIMLCNFLQTSGTKFEHFRTDFAKELTKLTIKLVKWARAIIL